ncbi:MAG: hypothetical protein MI922_30535 [Bacteroidales bacterium]|nr:hypothetical protein [Bacteroidales bacterium]
MIRLLFILIFAVILLGCKNHKEIGSGTIEYKITYVQTAKRGFDPALLPKKMILEFTPDSCVHSIHGFMGSFQLSSLIEFHKKKSKTHLKVFSKNYYYEGEKNELICCFDPMDNVVFNKDTATKTFAGLKSKRVIAKDKLSNREFDIYYTNDIYLPNANANNPYKKIDGILTFFQLSAGEYVMQFEAVKYSEVNSSRYKFKLPKNYKEVNRAQMTYLFNRLLSSDS